MGVPKWMQSPECASERKTNEELYSGGVFDISREAAIWIWSIFWEG